MIFIYAKYSKERLELDWKIDSLFQEYSKPGRISFWSIQDLPDRSKKITDHFILEVYP